MQVCECNAPQLKLSMQHQILKYEFLNWSLSGQMYAAELTLTMSLKWSKDLTQAIQHIIPAVDSGVGVDVDDQGE